MAVPLPAGVDALVLAFALVRPSLAYIGAAFATVGSVAGCLVLFYIARQGGQRYLDQHIQSGRGRRLRVWFARYGLTTVFVTGLLPIPLPTKIFVISAGALGVRAAPFLLVISAARIPRYFGLAWLGSQLGAGSTAWLRAHTWHLTVSALVLLGGLILAIRLAQRLRD